MAWQQCGVCFSGTNKSSPSKLEKHDQKMTRFHESSSDRNFRITINRQCAPHRKGVFSEGLEEETIEESKRVDFFVDVKELMKACSFFEKFEENGSVEIVTNCDSTSCSASSPSSRSSDSSECDRHIEVSSPVLPSHFHAFLDAIYPSVYKMRPVPVGIDNVVPILDTLAHFHCEPLLTNCERFLMSINIGQLEPIMLVRLLKVGLKVSLDHKILGRVLCVSLMNSAKLSDISQELTGNVGAIFAQAFVANSAKSFRHVKPFEPSSDRVCTAVRNLIRNHPSNQSNPDNATKPKKKKGCDHTSVDTFECILCFDKKCGMCKGEDSYCYTALDNFLYEVRQQLFPQTYKNYLDRESTRDDIVNHYLLRNQLLPLNE